MIKQYIVVNKSLNMSKGKLAAQVAHASSAYLTSLIKRSDPSCEAGIYKGEVQIPQDIYEGWINGIFTKVCLEAKSDIKMQNICKKLEDEGFVENIDYFKIVDVGTTEFNGVPHWTCIGVRPIDEEDERIKRALKGLQLFKD